MLFKALKMNLLNIYKPRGLTPLQAINLLKEKFPEYKDVKIGFAGRLDPLAHGVLLLMVGEETTKQKDKYLNFSKEYEFEAVFGVSTDTYDALGLLNNETMQQLNNKDLENKIKKFIKNKLGKQRQTYPPYSSKTVNSKPLFWWAREGKLSEIKIPQRKIEIYDFNLVEIKEISAAELKKEILKQVDSVQGDFRQKEIKEKWKNFFAVNKNENFEIARFKISCSSGTYVRSLVNELGEKLGSGAMTHQILRTKVGQYSLNDSLKFLGF